MLSAVISGIDAGVGNLIATEGKEKIYSIFKTSFLVSFWIYSWAVIFLFNLLEPFISWWIGEEYLLTKPIFIVVLINFYLNGMRGPIATFKNKAGLFVQDRYISVIEGLVNLFTSLILIKYFGFIGVFLGTTISTLTTVFWSQPRVTYKYLFKKPLIGYFIRYFTVIVIMILTGGITAFICNLLVSGTSFMSLIYRGIICLFVPNTIYLGVFFKTGEFKYLLNTFKNIMPQFVKNKMAI